MRWRPTRRRGVRPRPSHSQTVSHVEPRGLHSERLAGASSARPLASGGGRSSKSDRGSAAPPSRLLPEQRRSWVGRHANAVAAAVAALSCAPYLNSLHGDFVYDDKRSVVLNPDVVGGTPWGELWKHDFWGAHMGACPKLFHRQTNHRNIHKR